MSKTSGLVLVGVVAATSLWSCAPSTPKFAFTHAERRGKLAGNDMRFVIMPDESTQLAEVDVRYDVGSREDPPGKAGLAHLVEHMMFQQRPDGAQSPPLMQSINDISTFFNAYTDWDTTHYMTTARADNLDAMLKIEAMRMFYGCETIAEDEFLREREVVRNEIRQRGGTAEGQIPQLVMSAIYPQGHAYERMIGGDDMQLTTVTLQDACDFMKKYYTPERATVIVAGGIAVEKTAEDMQKWFGKIPKRPSAPRVPVEPIVVRQERKTFELDVERPSVHVAWVLPALNTPDGDEAQFGLNRAFGEIASKAEEYGFAYDVSAGVLGGKLAPVFVVSIELKGLGKLDEALEFVQKATKQAYRGYDMASYEQIEEIKNQRKASFIQGLEPLQARTKEMGDLVQFDTKFDFNSTDLYLFHELDKIAKFDGAHISAVVKRVVDWDKAKIVIVKPNKEGMKGDKRNARVKFQVSSEDKMQVSEIDPREAKRPVKVATELKGLSNAQRFTLPNGLEVVILPIKSMPLAAAQLIFKNVGDASTPTSPALAGAAATFMHLPADAEAFRATGISVRCSSTLDVAQCGTRGINIYLDVMLKGLERMISAGAYETEQIEGWQKQVREQFQTKSQQQQNEYQRQVFTALYGPDHPYTKVALTTPEAAGKISRDALVSFRKAHYTAANATLVIVGDFDPKTAENLARSTFGGWGKSTPAKPVDAAQYKRTGASFIGVVGKEQPQLTVTIAYPAPAGVDGQEGARRVLAEMLNERVADVRFKLGSTYGVYMGRRNHVGPSAYQLGGGAEVGGTIDAERAGESIKAMRDAIESLREGTKFDEDFVRARRKILTGLLGESTVTSELAGRLGFISTYGLDASFYNTLLQQVAAVSPAQLRALLKGELDPSNEVIVILGDRPHLDRAFAEAGLKDVKIVEPDYK
ncbi:MAG: pitrilysin family protein [Proteobacteria bacterium]|nr:pitrilysin family protein [Pseudomonadota bacterium]